MDTTTYKHRDSHEGLYARLADACYSARRVISEINEALPKDNDHEARIALENSLLDVQSLASDHFRVNWSRIVSRGEFNSVNEWFRRAFITGAWERTGNNEITWDIALTFGGNDFVEGSEESETGSVRLLLTAEGVANDEPFFFVEDFIVIPWDGESLTTGVGNAYDEANAYLRGIKRAYRI